VRGARPPARLCPDPPALRLLSPAKPIVLMTAYRRNFVPGATYFFTMAPADRRLALRTDHIEALRASFREIRLGHPFVIEAIVVLPDHLHAIWTLPEGDRDFSTRWSLIKANFSRALPRDEPISHSRRRKRERGIWQRRYWEHTIGDDDDFARHFDYVHFNPVKHGYVKDVADWRYSSFHRMARSGFYLPDWAIGTSDTDGDFGER
jgi:putative transposase